MALFRKIGFFAAILLAIGLASCSANDDNSQKSNSTDSWILVYENDREGNAVQGSKEDLIQYVYDGKPVRVVAIGRRIAHSADAQFLSVFEGEVFAQITPINSQRPDVDPPRIFFREPGQKWRAIFGTNGFFTAYMDGSEEPNVRTSPAKWYVQK